MKISALAFSALAGASLSLSSVAPAVAAQAAVHGHPLLTPISCNLCDNAAESGAFARFSNHVGAYYASFGMTGRLCEPSLVGARIDAANYPSNSWSITMTTNNGDPVFLTEIMTSSGPIYTSQLSSYNYNNGTVAATFNGAQLGYSGDKFISIYVSDSGDGYEANFSDTIDLGHGVKVDGVYPIPDLHGIGAGDCTGLFGGNVNVTI